MNTYQIEVTARLRSLYTVDAKDLDSAYVEALKQADDHLRDDGEMLGVEAFQFDMTGQRVKTERDYWTRFYHFLRPIRRLGE